MLKKILDGGNKKQQQQRPAPVNPVRSLNAVRNWVIDELVDEEREKLTTRNREEQQDIQDRIRALTTVKTGVDQCLDALEEIGETGERR